MHGDDEMLHGLRERVHDAEAQRSRVAHRTAAVAPDSTGAARAEGSMAARPPLDLHASTASEHALQEQSSQLQLQLEASHRRCHLLERRLHERQVSGGCCCERARRLPAAARTRGLTAAVPHQRWISPRHVLDLWEELERDVESIGIDAIGASIQDCKNQESEVRFSAGPRPAAGRTHALPT
jgi:hypothetical protein